MFILSFAAGGLDEGDNANWSVQHIFGSTSCATVAAGCEGLLSKPVLHDSTIEIHESIGSATLVAAMYQKCILQLYTDDTHVSGVPVLVSTTDGSKCHCSSGLNVSWQGFGRCIAGLGLNKHSSKAWFCVQAFAKRVALILTYSRDSLKCKLMLWNTLASGFLEAMPQALAPRPFCQAAPCHSIPEGPRTCTDSVQCLHGS